MARILIADATREAREALASPLRGAGFDVAVAATGREALERCRADAYDLVFADARLPDLRIPELLRALRSAAPAADVVAVAESPVVADVVEAVRLGARDYLCKPIGADVAVRLARETAARRTDARIPRPGGAPAVQSLQDLERSHILATLDRVGWSRKRAAELLQISTTTLWRRLKEFELEPRPSYGSGKDSARSTIASVTSSSGRPS